MALTTETPNLEELAIPICAALGLDAGNVSRIVIDLDASNPGPVFVYVRMIASKGLLDVDWTKLSGVEIKVVE